MYDKQKLDDAVLALLHLNSFPDHGAARAWKSFDWDAMDRLHQAGMITDPKSKTKSVLLTAEGEARAKALFEELFGVDQEP